MDEIKDRPMIVHHLIRAAILGGIAFYIARLQLTDHLTLYIAPRMTIYVKLAALGLYAVAAAQIYQALRIWNGREDDCGCEHPPPSTPLRSVMLYGLFIVPLALFFLSPDTTIGSALAAKKGITLDTSAAIRAKEGVPGTAGAQAAGGGPGGSAGGDSAAATVSSADSADAGIASAESAAGGAPGSGSASGSSGADAASGANGPAAAGGTMSDAKLAKLFPADEFTQDYAKFGIQLYKQPLITVKEKDYIEILTTVDLYMDNFIGKKMTIQGFVYRDDTLAADQFVLGRFAVQCCTADAIPYGVLIDSPDAGLYKNDTWLSMTGTLEKTSYDGNDIIMLKAEKTEKIKASSDPYVYPDMNFGV